MSVPCNPPYSPNNPPYSPNNPQFDPAKCSLNTCGVLPAPPAPTNITASFTPTQIVLSWTASAGATSYDVLRGTTSGGETLLESGVMTTGYTDSSGTPGQEYFYTVKAVGAGGTSPASNEVSILLSAPPPAPTNLTASFTPTQIVLSWTASAGATSYDVLRGTTSGGETLLESGVMTTGYTDSSGTPGTKYFYTIEAVGPGGQSPQSAELSVQVVLLDTFNQSNGTLLTSYAPTVGPGGDWLTSGTSLKVEGNAATLSIIGQVTNYIALGNLSQFSLGMGVQFLSSSPFMTLTVNVNSVSDSGSEGCYFDLTNSIAGTLGANSTSITLPEINDNLLHAVTFSLIAGILSLSLDGTVIGSINVESFSFTGTYFVLTALDYSGGSNEDLATNLVIASLG